MSVILISGDDGSNTLVGGAGQDLIYGFDPAGPQSQVSTISATRVATGLSAPLFAVAPPNLTESEGRVVRARERGIGSEG